MKHTEEAAKKLLAGAISAAFILDLRRYQSMAGGDLELGMELMAEDLGLKPEVKVIEDMDAYLEERAKRAGLIAPCINPFCTNGENGQPAVVDRRQRSSGACCKACMNYECTHPECVTKAQANGWKRYTHSWGTKIALAHLDYRKVSDG